MEKNQKNWISLGILVGFMIVFMGVNGGIETNFGKIDVSEITITTADGLTQTGKLYRPIDVDASNPAPGVLAIHGYNNDKHVQRPHSLEMAKRGIVVFAIDVIDHGDSDNAEYNETIPSFPVQIPLDAYDWLESQEFVDPNNMGVVGHSMGALWSNLVALFRPQVKVVGYQAFGADDFFGTIGTYAANNISLIQISSGMEEFGSRTSDQSPDEWKAFNEEWIQNNTETVGVGDGTGEFFKTYGDVTSGHAQRYVWLWKTHPGQTHDLTATKEITAFFMQVLLGTDTAPADIKTTYILGEVLGAGTALFLMLSIVPLVSLLLSTNTFEEVKQPMPEIKEELKTKKWIWWLFASVNFVLGGVLYFLTTDAPDGVQSWMFDANNLAKWTLNSSTENSLFDMGIGNAYFAFYVVNAIINAIFILAWYFIFGKKRGAKAIDLGVYTSDDSFKKNAKIFGKTVALAGVVFLYMYGLTIFSENIFNLEIRGPWSMFKTFTNARAARFWLYFPGVLLFFILNGGMWLFGLMRQKEYEGEFKTSMIWWIKVCFAMLTGLILLNIIGYFPMWIGSSGPTFQAASFGDGFAPMYLLQTWALIPTGAVMYWIAVKYYRETGRIWLGALMLAIMTTWIFTTGTIIQPYVL